MTSASPAVSHCERTLGAKLKNSCTASTANRTYLKYMLDWLKALHIFWIFMTITVL